MEYSDPGLTLITKVLSKLKVGDDIAIVAITHTQDYPNTRQSIALLHMWRMKNLCVWPGITLSRDQIRAIRSLLRGSGMLIEKRYMALWYYKPPTSRVRDIPVFDLLHLMMEEEWN